MSDSKHLVRVTCSKRTARKYDSALKVGRRGTDFALRKFQKLAHSAAGRRRRAAKHSIDKLLTHAFEPSLDTTAAGRIHEVEGSTIAKHRRSAANVVDQTWAEN